MLKINDLVCVNNLKNRWGIPPCGTVESLTETEADVMVFNLYGPGADMLVTNIPINELSIPTPSGNLNEIS